MRDRLLVAAAALSLILAACGTPAEPRPTFEPTNTALPRAANIQPADEDAESESVSEAETEVATEPTAVPPTLTPTPEPSPMPTEVPSEVPTEEPTEEPSGDHAGHGQEPTEAAPEEHADEHTEGAAADAVIVNGIQGDPAAGEFWFTGGVKVSYQGTEWQCSTCHNVDEPLPSNGPFLYGIANHAAEHGAEAGLGAVEYLADSILNPSHIIAPAQIAPDGTEYVWEDGKMPDNWNTVLDDTMLADLVAFLMQQTQEVETGAHGH